MHTGFSQAECTSFATIYNAMLAATPSVPYAPPLLCTTSGCNALVNPAASSAARAAAGVAAAVALGAALLL